MDENEVASPKIPGGCVLIARKMLSSDLMDHSPLVVKLWVWILLKANWKGREQLPRGQFVTTIAEMQEAMSHFAGWRKIVPTRDEIRNCYEALSRATRITTRKTTRGMVITVINYDTYQDINAYGAHTETLKDYGTKAPATPHDTEEGNKKENTSCPKPKKTSAPDSPTFDRSTGIFSNLDPYLNHWEEAYPAIDIESEIKKAAAWLITNPKNRKSNYTRFLNSWLSRAQDRAPRQTPPTPSTPAESDTTLTADQISQTMERRYAA